MVSKIVRREKAMEKLLTLPQLAEYLQVSGTKLYKMAQRNKIPASKVGGNWRFKQSHIDKWLDKLERLNSKRRKRS